MLLLKMPCLIHILINIEKIEKIVVDIQLIQIEIQASEHLPFEVEIYKQYKARGP